MASEPDNPRLARQRQRSQEAHLRRQERSEIVPPERYTFQSMARGYANVESDAGETIAAVWMSSGTNHPGDTVAVFRGGNQAIAYGREVAYSSERRRIILGGGVGAIVTNPLDPDDPDQPPPPETAPPGLATGGAIIYGGGAGGSINPFPGEFADSDGNPVSSPFPPAGNEVNDIQDEPSENRIAWQFSSQFAIAGGTRVRSWIVGPYAATLMLDRAETDLTAMPGQPLAEIWMDVYYNSQAAGGLLQNGGLLPPPTPYASHRGAIFSIDDNTGDVVRSEDNAATWTALTTQPGYTDSNSRIAATYGTLLIASYSDLYRTRDGGATWTSTQINTNGNGIAQVEAGTGTNWAMRSPSSVHISTDDGATWQNFGLYERSGNMEWLDLDDPANEPVMNNFDAERIKAIAWAGDALVAVTDDLQAYRYNSGVWSSAVDLAAIASGPADYDNVILLGAETELLLVGVTGQQLGNIVGRVLRSADGGQTWEELTI